MTPIAIQIAAGPQAGKRLLLEQTPITFGRAPENTLVLDLPYVSRLHGELRFEGGRWLLVNHSPNGTELNRHQVTDKPRDLAGPASVTIGKQPLLMLEPLAAGAAATAPVDPADAPPLHPEKNKASKRAKLWIGIGVYFVAMFAVILFFSTLKGDGGAMGSATAPEQLTGERIAEVIRRPLPGNSPDERQTIKALRNATELFALREAKPAARYSADLSYKQAASFARGHALAPLDQRRQHVVEEELIQQMKQRYADACSLLHDGQYKRALQAFRDLLDVYPGEQSDPIVRNIQAQADYAQRKLGNGG